MKKTIYKIYDPGNNFLISVNSWEQVGGVYVNIETIVK